MTTDSEKQPPAGTAPAHIADSDELNQIGHTQELERRFSPLSILGLAFAILNSWVAMSTSLSLALPAGGPSAVTWGVFVSGFGNLALAASLAECASVWPSSAGQYLWAYELSPPRWKREISWMCGWANVAGWWALIASGGSLAGQLITGIIALLHPGYVLQRWHTFIIYLAYTLLSLLLNLAVRLLPLLNKLSLFWSLSGCVIIILALLGSSSGQGYQSGRYVFGGYTNQTGWDGGVAWILGLLQSAFGLTGYDAICHCLEEIPNPRKEGPKAMMMAIAIGVVSSFLFLVVVLFCISDPDALLTASTGPLLEAFYQATRNKAGAVCLLMFPTVQMAFTTTGIMTSSSRMTWAFARDGGLPYSRLFARIDREVPLPSLILCTVLVIIFGCIYLGSSEALTAIISSSVVALQISYGIPVLLLFGKRLSRGDPLPDDRAFRLGRTFGLACNVVGLAWVGLTTVFFLFPSVLPVSAENMNYAIVVIGFVALIALGTWVTDGRKNYAGPRTHGVIEPTTAGSMSVSASEVTVTGETPPSEEEGAKKTAGGQ